jgi:hypothetical protein
MRLRAIWPFWLVCYCHLTGCGDEADPGGKDAGANGDCSAAAEPAAGFFPCDVEAVLSAKCQRCHNAPDVVRACTDAGTCAPAPFPLLEWSDTRRRLGEDPIYVLMGRAVASGAMPFMLTNITPPTEPLTSAEKQTLLDWIEACAPPSATACQ